MLEISCNHAAAYITTTHAYTGVPSQFFCSQQKPLKAVMDATLGVPQNRDCTGTGHVLFENTRRRQRTRWP